MTFFYYSDTVLFEIVKQLKNRECSFLGDIPPVRGIKAYAIRYLKSNFNAYKFNERTYNIYRSLATLRSFPMMSYNPQVRKDQMKEFNTNFNDNIVGYDLVMDFDESCIFLDKNTWNCSKLEKRTTTSECERCDRYCTNFDTCYEETEKMKNFLDSCELPYIIKFSGSGFHIEIPSEYLPDGVDKVELCGNFSKKFQQLFSFTTLDLSIYDSRRIWKVAYSLDVKTNRVALPLSDKQFNNFDYKYVDPKNVILDGVKNRGLLLRNSQNVKLFRKFLKDYRVM